MSDALNLILSKMTELSGALENVNSRLQAVETGARNVAASQAAATTHAKTKTRAPLPDNVHPTARTPTEPGTRRNPTEHPAICLAAECGETRTTGGACTHYSRALTIHFPHSEHVSKIIGGRSSSSRKETQQTEDELITQNDAWQTVMLWRNRGASFWLQPKDEPGQPKQAATQTDARTLSVLLADSILWVCRIDADNNDARRKLAEQVVSTYYGPAATTTKKSKAKS